MKNDYLLEKRMAEKKPELSNLMVESTFALRGVMKSSQLFHDFTDHEIIHSMNVINYCNMLIGEEQAKRLSGDECYVLVMACYFHDIGMCIGRDDYEQFSKRIEFGDYFETHDPDDMRTTIRDFHHEYSGLFIEKSRDLFEIPSDEHLLAIRQVARGHRKTDLFDEAEYPDIQLADGSIIHTSYLAAILRMADEIDVAVDRVPEMLYDLNQVKGFNNIVAFGTHHTIRRVIVAEDEIILCVRKDSEDYMQYVLELRDKISDTLRYCASVCAQRTPFTISQNRLTIEELPPDKSD